MEAPMTPVDAALETANDERLLDIFDAVLDEIHRRVKNYFDPRIEPAAVLEGIKFAAEAERIAVALAHNWPYGIYHARDTLTSVLAGTWESAP
jgi:hypothetical protein